MSWNQTQQHFVVTGHFFSNLHKRFIISGLSNFFLCNDVNADNEPEKNNKYGGIVWEMFFNHFSLCIAAHPVVFSCLERSVKISKCLGYLFLIFSCSSWKIRG